MMIDPNRENLSNQTRRHILQLTASIVTIGALGISSASATTPPTNSGDSKLRPDFGDHLTGVDGGYEDLRGEDQVTVEVGASGKYGGNLAFSPAAIWIDPGTTVIWEWTGEGGRHVIKTVDGPAMLDSHPGETNPNYTAGSTYEHTFTEDETGVTNYECTPHGSLGGKGAVAVGENVPTVGGKSTDETVDDAKNESEISSDDGTNESESSTELPEEEGNQTQTSDEEADNESESDEDDEGGTSSSVPGFGVITSITALGSVGYIIERRLMSDQSEK